MKKIFSFLLGISLLALPALTLAQGAMGSNNFPLGNSNASISEGEVRGKAIWDKLESKQSVCANLVDNDFELLGEYFMGQMIGSSHAVMNQMMEQMMGEKVADQMHVVLGKRLSGCDTTAAYPTGSWGFMPMMSMMGWGGSGSSYWPSTTNWRGGEDMMWGLYGGTGWSLIGMILMIAFWVLVIAAIVIFIKWLIDQSRGGRGKSALDIIKERYARGEISKKQFEEMKKDLE